MAYLSQGLRGAATFGDGQRDAADIFGHGTATDFVCELLAKHTS